LKWNRYSFHSDIWALGVMAYEMVYGKLPWKEKVESMLYEKIVNASL
jgi:SNF-related kinase